MNREVMDHAERLTKKRKEILWIGGVAFLLLIAVWQVFFTKDDVPSATVSVMTNNEQKVCQILREIEGVGEASVMICEGKDGRVESVVVVCDGANRLQVIMDVREAVAAALGAEEKSVKVYLKK